MINLEAAKAELEKTTYSQIQEQTAWKWASRAAASFDSVKVDSENKLICWSLAEEYFHEAVEHAAASDDESLVKNIKEAVAPYKGAAIVNMQLALVSKAENV